MGWFSVTRATAVYLTTHADPTQRRRESGDKPRAIQRNNGWEWLARSLEHPHVRGQCILVFLLTVPIDRPWRRWWCLGGMCRAVQDFSMLRKVRQSHNTQGEEGLGTRRHCSRRARGTEGRGHMQTRNAVWRDGVPCRGATTSSNSHRQGRRRCWILQRLP